MVQNRGIQPAGDINVKAKSVSLSGAIANTLIRSSLMSEALPTGGDIGNINITTERLKIEDGAF